MDQVNWWMRLEDAIDERKEWAGSMARGACSKGQYYWLGWYDALRDIAMHLAPIALSDEAPPQPTTPPAVPSSTAAGVA